MVEIKFASLKPGDVVELPGRKGKANRFEVLRKTGNMVTLQSLLDKAAKRVLMSNQFDREGFLEWKPEPPLLVEAASLSLPTDFTDVYSDANEGQPEDPEIAALRRKYGG